MGSFHYMVVVELAFIFYLEECWNPTWVPRGYGMWYGFMECKITEIMIGSHKMTSYCLLLPQKNRW